jgi:hypothetical protein
MAASSTRHEDLKANATRRHDMAGGTEVSLLFDAAAAKIMLAARSIFNLEVLGR